LHNFFPNTVVLDAVLHPHALLHHSHWIMMGEPSFKLHKLALHVWIAMPLKIHERSFPHARPLDANALGRFGAALAVKTVFWIFSITVGLDCFIPARTILISSCSTFITSDSLAEQGQSGIAASLADVAASNAVTKSLLDAMKCKHDVFVHGFSLLFGVAVQLASSCSLQWQPV
jgi:uncharacterized protein YceK